MEPTEIDSSVMEFEQEGPPAKKRKPAGAAGIMRIMASSTVDRLSSKRTVKELEYGRGAPGTRAAQHLWVGRFNAFREHTGGDTPDWTRRTKLYNSQDSIGLKLYNPEKPIKDPIPAVSSKECHLTVRCGIPWPRPSRETISSRFSMSYRDKPSQSVSVARGAIRLLTEYGVFTYTRAPGFGLTARDGLRLRPLGAGYARVSEGRQEHAQRGPGVLLPAPAGARALSHVPGGPVNRLRTTRRAHRGIKSSRGSVCLSPKISRWSHPCIATMRFLDVTKDKATRCKR